jgi:hypothetical protein
MNLINLNIRHAIKHRLLIEFEYKLETIVAEPFAYGVAPNGYLALLAYQIKPNDTEKRQWRLFDLDISIDIKIHCKSFDPQLRINYPNEMKQMKIIYTKI